jgi:hypothetical protein
MVDASRDINAWWMIPKTTGPSPASPRDLRVMCLVEVGSDSACTV